MRVALIVSLLLAVGAAVFAMQNPNETSLNIGPYVITASTALVIIVTFMLGVVVGILASVPSRIRQRREMRALKRSAPATTPTATSYDPLETRPHGTTDY